jgi:hypothetical protein
LPVRTIANGCTEAQAMTAAEMVGHLLERYALVLDEIEIRTARCVQVTVPLGGRRRRPIDGCVPALARAGSGLLVPPHDRRDLRSLRM